MSVLLPVRVLFGIVSPPVTLPHLLSRNSGSEFAFFPKSTLSANPISVSSRKSAICNLSGTSRKPYHWDTCHYHRCRPNC